MALLISFVDIPQTAQGLLLHISLDDSFIKPKQNVTEYQLQYQPTKHDTIENTTLLNVFWGLTM